METLEGKRILVTGGAGFIGSHIVAALAPDNEVTVLDDLSSGSEARLPEGVRFVEGDVRDPEALARAVADGVDVIFHEAANVSVARSVEAPLWSHEVNLDGTLSVLELARANDARLVFASSAAVYGDPVSMPVAETDPADPLSPYGIEKLAGDLYVRRYHDLYDVETVTLRYFNVYGPGQRAADYSGVISTFLERATSNRELTVDGDGEQTRDFVHVDDVVQANLLAATTEHLGEVFNVGSGSAVSILELARTVQELANSDADVVHGPPRPGDIRASCADISRARRLLGYEPTVGLRDGLSRMVD